MTQFKLFDHIKLTEIVSLRDGVIVSQDTSGTIVEIFKNGEAYLVEFSAIGLSILPMAILSQQIKKIKILLWKL